jgi:hypothetical protein
MKEIMTMESFDPINVTGAAPLFHVESAADPLRLVVTRRAFHESTAGGDRPLASSQAERSAMHPDRDDMEWDYCCSGRAG